MNRLFLAAGGGGDALMSKIISDTFKSSKNYFMTIVWERKMFDPKPGPRTVNDFINLEKYYDFNYIINKNTKLAYDGQTFIPKLCKELKTDYFLINLNNGVLGFKNQLNELTKNLKIDEIYIVDAGGDILAKGDEKTLKSPLADSFVLSSCNDIDIPVFVIAAGLGLDGELPIYELINIIDELESKQAVLDKFKLVSAIVKKYNDIFNWFPSEVTGMTSLVAQGFRGIAEIRDKGLTVELCDFSNYVYKLDFKEVYKRNIITQMISNSNDIKSIEKAVVDVSGKSEIEYERKKTNKIKTEFNQEFDYETLIKKLLSYSKKSKSNGVDYLSLRRVGEILEINHEIFNLLKQKLIINYKDNYMPPVWIC